MNHWTQLTLTRRAAAGGRFVMDVDAMKSLVPDWQRIADKLSDMIRDARQFEHLAQPANDPGSTLQKRAADRHARAYQANLQQQQAYAQGYTDRLKEAIAKYEQQDQANTHRLDKQG